MLQGISVSERIEFSCKDDKDPRTVFILKPLSGLDQFQFIEMFKDGKLSLNAVNIKSIIKSSLVEIKNFREGNLDEQIDALDFKTLNELITKIFSVNRLSEEQEKNLS